MDVISSEEKLAWTWLNLLNGHQWKIYQSENSDCNDLTPFKKIYKLYEIKKTAFYKNSVGTRICLQNMTNSMNEAAFIHIIRIIHAFGGTPALESNRMRCTPGVSWWTCLSVGCFRLVPSRLQSKAIKIFLNNLYRSNLLGCKSVILRTGILNLRLTVHISILPCLSPVPFYDMHDL